ncbi:InlB B-repeat-containing protein, partial [Paenibacillus hubeiensis]|uniref:InlB B-repeat-containing protein n=1 Tax=Paenibacillus hubeiensis TaxID=3077330 RepID=UPI0031BA213B
MIAQRIKRAGMLSLVFLLAISGLSSVLPVTPRAHAAAAEPLLGEIRLFPYDAAPNGWVPAEGQLLAISSNTELFSLLGANYGVGDNQTFVLPNLSNQAPGGTRYYIATNGIFPSREEGSGIANAVLGEIRLFPYYFSPSGWLTAEGQTLEIASFPSLYSLIGKKYGGDGETTFQLPNLPTNEQTPLHYAIFTNSTYSPLTGGTGDEYMGEIIPMPVQVSNPEWIQADGTLLTINANRALFDLLGNRYGGDGMTGFNIPDLTGDPSGIIYYISKVGASPIGDRALANNDQYLTNGGTTLTVASPGVLANDINVSTARLINSPTNGAITLNSNGAFMYTPNIGFSGNDRFQYIGSGSIGDSNAATVTITVTATNKPVITGVNDQTTYNGPVTPTFDGGTALLNGSPFTSGTSITGEGSYTLAVTNNAGTTTVHFVIDSTPPVVIGVADDAVYETAPTIAFNEGTATLDGSPFASGGTVSREGTHVLVVTDAAGNTTTVAFKYYAPRTVTFVSSGGTSTPAQSVRYASRLAEPDAPSRTGYTFAGWFTDSELTQAFDFDNTTITSDLTLYAKWTIHSFNVQFNTNGGSAVDGQQVDYNDFAHRPDAPSRTGYTFEGWFTDSELTQAFDFDNTVITDNLTLYAKWTIHSFNVQFNTNGGSAVGGQQVDYNALAHRPDTPSRTGYTFEGWFTDSELTQAFDFDNTVITDNLTLYAKWTIHSFNVQFNT